eukprot:GHVO01067729.1.p1 GENE.GHVO01067729.1~~GHVO01067729.1.p1  ORF type:complete len:288 (+),score=37.56 GHVO01067729.1:49-864(+)
MMHNEGQMKLFLVGGPNQRKDFHVDCCEELFYQIKGQMCLKVIEQGKHRDIFIKEGQMFLLPARVQHSPNRYENTVGMVIERVRDESEKDGLRYFQEQDGKMTLDPLYEAYFHCTDLGTQLAPIIKGFFASEQYKTGKPIPGSGTIFEQPPIDIDHETKLQDPINFKEWINEHRDELKKRGKVPVYDNKRFQFQVYAFGKGTHEEHSPVAETFIWQLEGQSAVEIEGKDFAMKKDDSLLVPVNQKYSVTQDEDSICLVTWQDHSKAPTWPK